MENIVLGDIHFRDDKPYWKVICEKFLDWFKNYEKNNSENNLFLAGDLVEDKILSGIVADYLYRFLRYSKFKNIYICVGNHDRKEYHNSYQLSYEFYKNYSNVHIYEEASEINVDGFKVLILPYYQGVNRYGKPMNEYYSNIYKNKIFSNNYDLVLGHFSAEDKDLFGSSECISNLDKINAKKIILGHIHTRGMGEDTYYIGSVFAGKKSENDYRRCAMVYKDGVWSEDKLPLFNEFLSVTYPEELPESKALVPIYTILNCTSESVALSKYKGIFIRRVTTDSIDVSIGKRADMDRQFSSVKEMDTRLLFQAFIDSQEPPLEKEIIKDCNEYLEKMIGI